MEVTIMRYSFTEKTSHRQQETAYFSKLEDAFKKAICWNPVDLDSYLGLAECYKNLNKRKNSS